MQKLYCYVDESGQDTRGKLFLVSVVITGEQREELRNALNRIEKESGRKSKKWMKSTRKQREQYMVALILERGLAGKIYYSQYSGQGSYMELTMLATAKAIFEKARRSHEATVYVDGLKRTERYKFGAGLRQLEVRVKKVRGMREQSDELMRLADAISGFVRNAVEGDVAMLQLYRRALKRKLIQKI